MESNKIVKSNNYMISLALNFIIDIMLNHFQIKKINIKSYLDFCKSEKRKPFNDFVEYILTKVPDNTFIVNHNKYNKYKFYICDNKVFFSKLGEEENIVIGKF
jgi:hypothetical protein